MQGALNSIKPLAETALVAWHASKPGMTRDEFIEHNYIEIDKAITEDTKHA
ncbi:hypothetical protein SPH9361_02807 [Sphingobium sp. CECT 9361]|jgi:hypothetical protein|nr:hypothetical protein SPH9361_02807 [Sphingobium sp. CECT 9361]